MEHHASDTYQSAKSKKAEAIRSSQHPEDAKQLLEDNQHKDKPTKESSLRIFKNVIIRSAKSDVDGIAHHYLINTDRLNSYNVTIKTLWRTGLQCGTSYTTHFMEPNGEILLGSSLEPGNPPTINIRYITDESVC